MSAIDTIKDRLREHGVAYQETKDGLCVPPVNENGFEVCLEVSLGSYHIVAMKWHEEFTTDEAAIRVFQHLLSEEARLRVDSRAGFDYKWTVEVDRNQEWVDAGMTSYFFFRTS